MILWASEGCPISHDPQRQRLPPGFMKEGSPVDRRTDMTEHIRSTFFHTYMIGNYYSRLWMFQMNF